MHVNDWNYASYTAPKSRLRRLLTARLTRVGFLLVFLGMGGWYAFLHTTPVDEKDLPLIKAEAGALKYRPPNAGELTVPHQDKLVYSRLVGGEEESALKEKFLPLPEAPLAGLPAASNVPQGDEAPADDHPDAIVSSEIEASSASALGAAAALNKDEIASLISAIDDETTKDTPLTPAPAAQAPLTSTSSPAKPQATVTYRIQFAAFPSLERAKKGWQHLSTKYKKQFKGLTPHYVKRQGKGSKAFLYLLQAGPFKSKTQAQEACRAMAAFRAKSSTPCRVITVEKDKERT